LAAKLLYKTRRTWHTLKNHRFREIGLTEQILRSASALSVFGRSSDRRGQPNSGELVNSRTDLFFNQFSERLLIVVDLLACESIDDYHYVVTQVQVSAEIKDNQWRETRIANGTFGVLGEDEGLLAITFSSGSRNLE